MPTYSEGIKCSLSRLKVSNNLQENYVMEWLDMSKVSSGGWSTCI